MAADAMAPNVKLLSCTVYYMGGVWPNLQDNDSHKQQKQATRKILK